MAPSPFPASPVPIGSLVAGKYRVDAVLGRGGMGVVLAATDLGLERKVAIKFVERQDEQAAARFLREARAAARVDSEHVTRVFEVGVEHKAPFIVMERLEGQDLAALIAAGPVPGPVAAGYGLQICEALAQAHAARIVHRDLKPENLFLHTRNDGRRMIKVLDFGISKSLEGTVLTQSQAIVGTPQYLAPEQIEHPERVDPRTDIWALGVVLYELASGERPFRGGSMAELCMNILAGQPAPLGSKVRGLPVGLERAVQRCLSKSMEERFANVAELARELATASDPDSALLLSTIERATERGLPAPNGGTATPAPDAAPLARTEALAGSALGATPVADTERSAFGERPARTASRRGSGAVAVAATLALVAAVLWNARRERETRTESAVATMAAAPALSAEPSSVGAGASAPAVSPAPVTSEAPSAPLDPPPIAPAPVTASAPAATAAAPRAAERAARIRSTPPAVVPGAAVTPPPPAAVTPAASPAEAAKAPSAGVSNAPSAGAASAGAASCRVLEVIANGRKVEPAAGRVTFEWARRSCAQHAQPGGKPYDLSDAGMSVKCVCD